MADLPEAFGFPDGPYVNAAFWCERTLEEKDGVVSAIRIVDRVVATVGGVGVPQDMPRLPIQLVLFVIIKSGRARGRHGLRMSIEGPDGMSRSLGGSVALQLDGDERGHNLVFRLTMEVQLEGLYWTTILVNDRPIARVPLRVVYQPQEMGTQP